ncbi:isochorismatase family cysteine hydrolase [Vacuolonema iberomarrocanum]|uniref:isochorismatase family cysteine hydrolase n=1 Tax=Vacuolonema iberomarrocanum TaxID=3454632 RepID=UPI0019F137E0|nr:cysteine hydrolase [filamentous cyanobacterium LEGE 07170]
MKSLLLVIDLQNDFTQPNGRSSACTEQIEDVVATINATVNTRQQQNESSAIVVTDWSNPLMRWMTKNSMTPGTVGAALDSRLNTDGIRQYTKGSKSIFSSQELLAELEREGIEHLILSGLAAEHCISVSAKEARKRGFKVSYLPGAVASYQCKNLKPALVKLESIGVEAYEVSGKSEQSSPSKV